MRVLLTSVLFLVALPAIAYAAPPVELELATERGLQITAPHEWLQLLTAMGIDNVRIRGMTPGDEVKATNRGTAERPRYRVVGILTAGNQLRLPGETFTRGDRARLKDYFERLAADGAESLTATRSYFGLTEKELAAVTAELAQPIDFETKGQPPRAVIDRIQSKFSLKAVFDADAQRALRAGKPVADELKRITAGTGLAMMLRSCGLVMRPEKLRGEPVVYRVVAGGSPAMATTGGPPIATATAGKTAGREMPHWPVGWEPQQTPGRTAPQLFEPRNAEIDGFTLAETLAAIESRIKIPIFLDHAALAARRIEPDKIQVRLPRTRSVYKRIIDRVLAQARLHSQVRVDEAGTPFLWVTR
jgi:hypothetical protein